MGQHYDLFSHRGNQFIARPEILLHWIGVAVIRLDGAIHPYLLFPIPHTLYPIPYRAALEPEQIAEFGEESVSLSPQAPEVKWFRLIHRAAVAGEHDRSGHGLIAEEGVYLKLIGGPDPGARKSAGAGDQDRRAGPGIIA